MATTNDRLDKLEASLEEALVLLKEIHTANLNAANTLSGISDQAGPIIEKLQNSPILKMLGG